MNRTSWLELPARLSGWRPGLAALLVLLTGLTVAVWLYLGLPLLFLPVVPLGLSALFVALSYPLAGLSFVIAAQYIPIEIGGITVFQLAGTVVAVVTLIWFGLTKRSFVVPGIIFPTVVFTILTLYSLTYTHDAEMTSYAVRKFVLNILFCALLVNMVGSFQRFRQPLLVVVGMGVMNSAVAIIQFSTGWQRVEERSRGLLENENALGEVAATAFIVPFYIFLYSQQRWKRVVCLFLCAVLFFGMVTSISRGAFLAFLGGLLFILGREKKYRLRLVFVALLIAAVYPLLPEAFSHRFGNLGQEIQGTVDLSRRFGLSARGYFNKAGIRMWKSNPTLGVGIGNFGYYFQMPGFNPGFRGSRRVPPHNLYIQALAETGTVGFIVLSWWILQAAYNYWVAEKKGVADEDHRVLLRSCETITLITLISAFSSGHLTSTHMAMVLAFSEVCRRATGLAGTPPPGDGDLPARRDDAGIR